MTLEDFKISGLPSTAIYIPSFINIEEEKELLSKVYSVPKPKWTQLMNRRLQNWGGIPHAKGMIPDSIPDWLQKYLNRISVLNIFPPSSLPNHVLINEYTPGQGIMPHTDGPLFHPVVATISCGSHTLLNFLLHDKQEPVSEKDCTGTKKFSLLLEPRSLLVLKNDVYEKYMHGIEERKEDLISKDICNLKKCEKMYQEGCLERNTRISLTIRNVPRCCKMKLQFRK